MALWGSFGASRALGSFREKRFGHRSLRGPRPASLFKVVVHGVLVIYWQLSFREVTFEAFL